MYISFKLVNVTHMKIDGLNSVAFQWPSVFFLCHVCYARFQCIAFEKPFIYIYKIVKLSNFFFYSFPLNLKMFLASYFILAYYSYLYY